MDHRRLLSTLVWIPGLALTLEAGPLANAQTVPGFINYQGRLTDAAGAPLPNGIYRVAFRLWNDPASASTNSPNHLVWGAEYDVTLVNGSFNVILGAPGGLGVSGAAVNDISFAFASPDRFLGLTLTRLADGSMIAPANQREIVPRQQILSAPFAMFSQSAATVLPASITSESIQPNAVQATHLRSGIVDVTKLAERPRGTNVPLGGIGVSLPVTRQRLTGSTFQDITNLSLTIQTSGRPVMIFLAPSLEKASPNSAPSETEFTGLYFVVGGSGANTGHFRLIRTTSTVASQAAIVTTFGSGAGGSESVGYPTPMGPLLDLPPAGTQTYKLQWGFVTSEGQRADIQNQVLVAFEL